MKAATEVPVDPRSGSPDNTLDDDAGSGGKAQKKKQPRRSRQTLNMQCSPSVEVLSLKRKPFLKRPQI